MAYLKEGGHKTGMQASRGNLRINNSYPLPEFRSEIHLLQHSIKEVPVDSVKCFFLVKTDNN